MMTIFAVLLLLAGVGILVHRAFVYGYNAGWDERQRDMVISVTRAARADEVTS